MHEGRRPGQGVCAREPDRRRSREGQAVPQRRRHRESETDAKPAPVAPQRPAEPRAAGKMPVIVTPKPAAPTLRPKSAEPNCRTGTRAGAKLRSPRQRLPSESRRRSRAFAPPRAIGGRDGPREIHRSRHSVGQGARRRRREPRVGARRSPMAERHRASSRPAVKLAPMPKIAAAERRTSLQRAAGSEAGPAVARRIAWRGQAGQQTARRALEAPRAHARRGKEAAQRSEGPAAGRRAASRQDGEEEEARRGKGKRASRQGGRRQKR